jgi:hypothetical protein
VSWSSAPTSVDADLRRRLVLAPVGVDERDDDLLGRVVGDPVRLGLLRVDHQLHDGLAERPVDPRSAVAMSRIDVSVERVICRSR